MASKIITIILIAVYLTTAYGNHAQDDFYIGQGDSGVIFNCADSKSIAVKYWNLCSLRIQLSDCPMASLGRRFAADSDDDLYYRSLELKKNRYIKLDQDIVESIKTSNTFLTVNKRAGNARLRNIRRICCKTAVPDCTDRQFAKTCPGGIKYKQNTYNEIVFIGCSLAADELINEG